VGAPGASPHGVSSGRSYVIFGKTDGDVVSLADVAEGTDGFAIDGENADDRTGERVSLADDVNGDGLIDFIIAASRADTDGVEAGRSYVVFGNTAQARIELSDVAVGIGGFVLVGEVRRDQGVIASAGDINGDGLSDVVIGAFNADFSGQNSGRTYVAFGKIDTSPVLLRDVATGLGGFAIDGEFVNSLSGRSVGPAGDIDGDGLGDIVLAAPFFFENAMTFGRTYVVFGKTDGGAVSLIDVAAGRGGFPMISEPGAVTETIVGGSDVNGDGRRDFIVSSAGSGRQRNYVVFGRPDSGSIALAAIALGEGGFAIDDDTTLNQRSGLSLAFAGDIDRDGLVDMLMGAPGFGTSAGVFPGRSYLVFGKADGSAVLLSDLARREGGFAWEGEAALDQAGFSVSSGGDVNGDGRLDFLVGAPTADVRGPDSGRVYVVFGE